jgi:hypothetical protein
MQIRFPVVHREFSLQWSGGWRSVVVSASCLSHWQRRQTLSLAGRGGLVTW